MKLHEEFEKHLHMGGLEGLFGPLVPEKPPFTQWHNVIPSFDQYSTCYLSPWVGGGGCGDPTVNKADTSLCYHGVYIPLCNDSSCQHLCLILGA